MHRSLSSRSTLGFSPCAFCFDNLRSNSDGTLQAENKTDLIALYAASLGSAAVDRYSEYLASLPSSITREERHAALKRAREHNVDPIQVALTVADKVAGIAFKHLQGLRVTAPDPVELYQRRRLDEEELRLVKSVEWLVFEDDTLPKALLLVNSIVRYFLGTSRITVVFISESN